MQTQAREISYFFYSQSFADGFRITFAILIPALLGYYFGFFDIGLTISLGAMCVSLTDAPGPITHRRNAMLITAGLAFVVAAITSVARWNVYSMGLEIAVFTFLFSMFNVFDNRAASVGTAAMLIMVLSMDTPVDPSRVLPHAALILSGGIFYTMLSLLLHRLRPYRLGQRALADCIREIAAYLSIKSDFYDVATDLPANYKKMVAKQIEVNEKQDAAREIFFKTRQIVDESTREGRKLVFTFVETVDLFENITATYYDYAQLRNRFAPTGALEVIHDALKRIAHELDSIALSIQANSAFKSTFDYEEEVRKLKVDIDRIAPKGRQQTMVLRKILVNIRKILTGINNINQYFESDINRKTPIIDHSHFVSSQAFDTKTIWNNLSLRSSVFRHSLRVCIASLVGFVVVKMTGYGQYSYWVLMTIAFILKPAFSLTKQRNIERIIGTLAGGSIGVLILLLTSNQTIHFICMVVFMIGTYSFLRIRYLVMVICTTPYVLILFSFLGNNFRIVAQERIFDTVLGCAIAFAAGYFLFPRWESQQLRSYFHGILRANAAYLHKIIEALSGQRPGTLEYKLARKDVYVHSANLSAAFQRMLSEPKSKQRGEKHVHQFVVLNHILFSNIATAATTLLSKESRTYPAELIHIAKRARASLCESSKRFGEDSLRFQEPGNVNSEPVTTADDILMREQLLFILSVSMDIEKTSRVLIG